LFRHQFPFCVAAGECGGLSHGPVNQAIPLNVRATTANLREPKKYEEPQYMSLADQHNLNTKTLLDLPRFGFLLRPAETQQLTGFRIQVDPLSKEELFARTAFAYKIRLKLMQRDGKQIEKLQTEIVRQPQNLPQKQVAEKQAQYAEKPPQLPFQSSGEL